jgi:putative addiction module component (TIGR02574 family)
MSPREKLLAEALALPEKDRAELARDLLASLEGVDDGADEAWRIEIATRLAEYRAGNAEVLSYEEVMAELRAMDHEA